MELQKAVVLLYMLAASFLGSGGLEFHLDTKHDACDKLLCNVSASLPNHEILSVLKLAVFDTTQSSSRLLLASVSVLEPHVHVNDATKHNIIGVNGNISEYHADLQISLRKQSCCHSSSFICELTYINPSGHIDMVESTEVKAESDGDAGGICTGVSSDMMDAVNQLINRTDNIESAVATVEKKVDGVAQQLSYITSLLTKLVGDEHKDDLTQYNCYKGINGSNVPARTLITVVGDKEALCDTVTDGGGWVVFQNKVELRVDTEKDGQPYYAQYSTFSIGNETTDYVLNVDGYSGDAGDSLHYYHNRMKFSTMDRDNDVSTSRNCAEVFHGAWWYYDCHVSHLNGLWGPITNGSRVYWEYDLGRVALSYTEMKIRLIS